MRRLCVWLLVVMALPVGASAQTRSRELMTVSTTAVSFDTTTLAGPMTTCTARVEDAGIRYTLDGTTPTASVGIEIAEDVYLTIDGAGALASFQAIRSGGTDASLDWQCSSAARPESHVVGASTGGGGGAGGVTTDVEDGAGDSIMDAANDAMQVNCVTGCTPSATFGDDDDFTVGSTSFNITGGLYDSAPTNCTDGDACAALITQGRRLMVDETNSAAILADTAAMDTNLASLGGTVSGNELQVDVLTMPTTTVTATNLDVQIGGSDVVQVGDNSTTLSVDDGAGSITVDATNLDVQIGGSDVVTVDLAGNNDVTVEGGAVLGTDGLAGPANALSVGGTESDGTFQELLTDATGHLQVDVLTAPTTTVTATNLDVQIGGSDVVTVDLASNNDVTIEGGAVLGTDGVAGPANAISIGGTESGGTFQEIAVDSSGNLQVDIVSGSSSGTQYTEDDAAVANPVGTQPVLVRADTPSTLVSLDGDVVAQRSTNYGAAYVQIVDSSGNYVDTFGGSGGTATADDADFVAGTTQGTQIQGLYESSPTSVTDGDVGQVGITQTRSLKVEETNSTAILADTANIDTNVGTLAGAVTGTEFQVDIVSDGAGLLTTTAHDAALGTAGTADAQVRTIQGIAGMTAVQVGDNSTTLSIDDGAGSITVDATNLDVQSGGGDLLLNSTFTTTFGADTVFGTAGTADADVMTIQGIASMTPIQVGDNSSTLSIDDGSGSLTVDGTVTVTATNLDVQSGGADLATSAQGSATQTAVEIIDDWDEVHDAAVGTDGAMVMLEAKDQDGAALPNAVNAEGDAVRASASLSGVAYMMPVNEDGSDVATVNVGTVTNAVTLDDQQADDDSIAYSLTVPTTVTLSYCDNGTTWERCSSGVAEDAAHSTGDTGLPLFAVRDDSPPAAVSGTTGDYEPLHTNAFGAVYQVGFLCGDPEMVTSVAVSTSASGNVQLVALAANQTVFVCGYQLTMAAAETFQFIYGTGTACATGETDLTGDLAPGANGGFSVSNAGAVQFKTAVGEALCVEKSGTGALAGVVTYVQVDITP